MLHPSILAISGGADSVAMLRLFAEKSQCDFAVAHVNHNLRGAESDGDALFVRNLAESLNVPFFETRLGTQASREQCGQDARVPRLNEADLRKARYDFLCRTAQENGFRYVAVAHNADDQIETVLHRIIRGTGIKGLCGIPRVRQINDAVALFRPMLDWRRRDILEYLEKLSQPYRVDSSNKECKFTRNRIRNSLLPLLESQYNPQTASALLRLAKQAEELQEIVDCRAEQLFENAVSLISDSEATVNLANLANEPPYLVRECFMLLWKRQNWPMQRMGAKEWQTLVEINSKARVFPGGIRVERKDDSIHINT